MERRSILVLFALVLSAAGAPPAQEKVLSEEWLGLYMMGNKVGYSHTRVVARTGEEGTRITTSERTVIKIKRMGRSIASTEESEVTEDDRGRLLSFSHRERQSAQEKATEGRSEGDFLVFTRIQGGREQEVEKVPYPAGALPPYAVERYQRKLGLKEEAAGRVKIFLAAMPDRPAELTLRVGGREETEVLGEKRTLWRVEGSMQVRGVAIDTVEWVSDDFVAWRVEAMRGLIKGYKLPRELALREGKVEELFLATLVAPDRKIEKARTVRELAYRLTLPPGESFQALPRGAGQEVRKEEGNRVEIRIGPVEPARPLPRPVRTPGMEKYLAPTPFLQSGDPAIAKQAAAVVGEEEDSLAAARLLEKWVFKNIANKHFGLGFATAAEVMKNLEGDCSEHAVLLAALCRAAGIPSRVAAGLIYADSLVAERAKSGVGAFGYHMWTEVFVGEWVPLDATLGVGYCDATHIALARSPLESESAIFDLVPVGLYIGRLQVEVLSPAGEVTPSERPGPGSGPGR